ncbi:MAG TPA: TA system VapC family ribonuclease toxin [Acidimicrobiales bacterium]|nr:TA system VapC family ribonuclease toxin [Acidimicrobiales bacterium]
MTTTLDTNVFVYASDAGAPEHTRATALLEHLAAGPDLVVLLWPALLGYLRIVTHPSICASPLPFDVARANVDALLALPHIRAAGETADHWRAFCAVTDATAVRGNLVPDAHLVALMRTHGVHHIWSRDRDLRRFDGISVSDPFDDRYAEQFPRR